MNDTIEYTEDGYLALPLDGIFMTPEKTQLVREFFRAEEDERLGRWRYDEKTVVYPQEDDDHVKAVDETSGDSIESCRGTTLTGHLKDAARAYFDAHPEPKPWESAKHGEAWLVTLGFGEPTPMIVDRESQDFPRFIDPIEDMAYGPKAGITAATRIYPKEEA